MFDEQTRMHLVTLYIQAAAKARLKRVDAARLQAKYAFLRHLLRKREVSDCLTRLAETGSFLEPASEDGWYRIRPSDGDLDDRSSAAKDAILVKIHNYREAVLQRLSIALLEEPPQGDPVWLLFKDRLFAAQLQRLTQLAKDLGVLRTSPTLEITQQFFETSISWLGLEVEQYVDVPNLPLPAVEAHLDIPALATPLLAMIYLVSSEDQLEYVELAARRIAERHVFVFYLSDDPAPLDQLHVSGHKIVRVALGLLFLVAASKERRKQFAAETLKQADLVILSPYKTQGAVSHKMFFGRETELAMLTNKTDSSFAIYGPRRIGKTSLGHELKFILEAQQERGEEPVYCDCSVLDTFEDVCYKLARLLRASWNRGQPRAEFLEAIHEAREERIPRGKFVLILDEVDSLISKDHKAHADFFWTIRTLTNDKVARIIVCGYEKLRLASRDLRHPAYNMFDDIHLDNLARDDAEQLIVSPLAGLGISFHRSRASIVGQILNRTSTHPGTIQFFCGQLLRLLNEREDKTITREDIGSVEESNEFVGYVLDGVKDLPESHRKLISAHTAVGFVTISNIASNCQGILEQDEVKKVVDDLLRLMILREDPEARTYLCYAQPAIPRVVKRVGGVDKVR